MTKQEVRTHYLAQRNALTDFEYSHLSQDLCDIFFLNIDLSSIKTLHVFLPITSKKEPNTWLFIDRLIKAFSHIRISIPKMIGENALINFNFEGKNQIRENKWKIPEPQFGEMTPLEEIDLVIVPLLAFDRKGHRVGYGKGYYDRFLKECRSDCKKIGLSFFDPVEEISDTGAHDMRLTQGITPKKNYNF